MRASVQLILPDGSQTELCPGDLIGRLWSAALRVDNARVSEAHALISLRGQELKMLALRGVLAVGSKRVSEVALEPGLTIELARDYALRVGEVVLPTEVFAVELPGLPPQQLGAAVYSVVASPRPGIVRGNVKEAVASLWSTGEGWRLQVGTEPSVELVADSEWTIEDFTLRALLQPLHVASLSDTRMVGRLHKPLRIVAAFESVHIHRRGEPTLTLGGLSARIMSELVAIDGPVGWEAVAEEIWRGEADRHTLRHKWDVNVSRLRAKLRAAGIRPDLVRADGSGTFELLLLSEDEVEDRT